MANKKAIWITIGSVVLLGGGLLLWNYNKNKKKSGAKKDDKSSGGNKSADVTSKDTASSDIPKDETSTSGSSSSTSTSTSGDSTSGSSQVDTTLPNHGEGCSPLRDKFDGNFNYIKCKGNWYTISKLHPKNSSTKGKVPNWKDISGNKAATDKLNKAYPND